MGVSFALVVCTKRVLTQCDYFSPGGEPDLYELLPLVALATVADIVELQGENRALAAHAFHTIPRLRALCASFRSEPDSSADCRSGWLQVRSSH
jgi:single-stranded DNA-specific DHH superfamily exonuclease